MAPAHQMIKDRIEATNYVFKAIQKNIARSKGTLLESLFEEMNKERIFYHRNFINFTEIVNIVVKNTSKGFFTGPKTKTDKELQEILIKLLSVLRVVIVKGGVHRDITDFIKTADGYDITNKDSIDLINVMINYKVPHTIDTVEYLSMIFPNILEMFKEEDPRVDLKSMVDATQASWKSRAEEKRQEAPRPYVPAPRAPERAPEPERKKYEGKKEEKKASSKINFAEPKTRRSGRRSTRRTRKH
jgi:hypothetical protein